MTNEKMQKLVGYLFPTEEVRSFLCNDLFMELKNIIPIDECIDFQNLNEENRKNNKISAINKLINFLNENKEYLQTVLDLYNIKKLEYEKIDDILMAYVFFMAKTDENYSNINIFKDKRSICYAVASVYDIL